MPSDLFIGFDAFTADDLRAVAAFAVLIGVVVILVLALLYGGRRRREMEGLARELGCTFTKKISLPGSVWRRQWKNNIIEGNWRGQKILIYDFSSHSAGSEYVDGHTMINGKKYEGRWNDWISVDKIRRVLAGDSTIQPVDDNAKPTLIGKIVMYIVIVAVIAYLVVGLGGIAYEFVKLIISL